MVIKLGFFEALIDDVIGLTHSVWLKKSKIQTQYFLVKKENYYFGIDLGEIADLRKIHIYLKDHWKKN